MTNSKMLVLGVGNAQVDLLNVCNEKGVRVCGVSNDPSGPGVSLCENFTLADIRDLSAVIEIAKKEKVNAIYSVGSDIAMPTACRASELLGLPYFVESSVADVCNNKGLLKAALAHAGLPVPAYKVMDSVGDISEVPMPSIIKPLDSQGQRGISNIRCIDELAPAFERAVQFSSQRKAIVEEFIEGPEISVNTYSVNGKMQIARVTSRIVWDGLPGGIIKAHELPADFLSEAVRDAVLNSVDHALNALGIANGPAYFQIMLKKGVEPFIIEATPRLDGCHLWRLIKISCGIDLLEITVAHLLGVRLPEFPETINTRPSRLEFFCQPPGTEFERSKFDASHAEFLKWYYEDGQSVKQINGMIEKCGYIIRKF